MKLLNENELHQSIVVANCRMNRERQAFGDNSYQKDIDLDPYLFLTDIVESSRKIRWLDICCGSGNALIQVMKRLIEDKTENNFDLYGVDLVGMFTSIPNEYNNLTLIESSLQDFEIKKSFDLITCVHGLHYIGDKLNTLRKFIQYLKQDGLFICNLDTNNILGENGKPLGRKINSILRNNGIDYNSRKKLLKCRGRLTIDFPFQYKGANEKFGKNYTGQEIVSSHYSILNNEHST